MAEINDSQQVVWTRAIEVFEETGRAQQVAIFPRDRRAQELDCEVVQIRLSALSLHRPRQWEACWLALELWDQLDLDGFWSPRLHASRQGHPLAERAQDAGGLSADRSGQRMAAASAIWYRHSALGDLLGEDLRGRARRYVHRCLDKLLAHKAALLAWLHDRWASSLGTRFEVLLYDLTSICLESDPPGEGKRQFGYSRNKRFDCVQVVIALIVAPDGFSIA